MRVNINGVELSLGLDSKPAQITQGEWDDLVDSVKIISNYLELYRDPAAGNGAGVIRSRRFDDKAGQ